MQEIVRLHELYNRKEDGQVVRGLLNCSQPTVIKMRQRPDFPKLRVFGGTVKGYLRDEVVAWLRSQGGDNNAA